MFRCAGDDEDTSPPVRRQKTFIVGTYVKSSILLKGYSSARFIDDSDDNDDNDDRAGRKGANSSSAKPKARPRYVLGIINRVCQNYEISCSTLSMKKDESKEAGSGSHNTLKPAARCAILAWAPPFEEGH